MNKKICVLAVIVLGMVALSASSAMALCSPPKVFHSWDASTYYYGYVYNYSGDMGNTVGAFWEPGARTESNEGTFTVDNWLRYYAATSKWYITGNTGTAGVVGCPGGQIVVAISEAQGTTANFAIAQADETPTRNFHFNLANMTLTPIPRPQITNRSRAGDIVTLDMQAVDVASGFSTRFGGVAASYITGINFYSFTGNTDPGRDAAAWTFLRTEPYVAGATAALSVDVDCSDQLSDVFLAAGVQLTGEYNTVHLGASTIVECDPTLADPDDKFDLIRDRGKGQKKGTPFNRR